MDNMPTSSPDEPVSKRPRISSQHSVNGFLVVQKKSSQDVVQGSQDCLVAAVETVALVAKKADKDYPSQLTRLSSEPNFKAFVRKGQSPSGRNKPLKPRISDNIPLKEHPLVEYDENEYQVSKAEENDVDSDFEEFSPATVKSKGRNKRK